MSNFFVLSLMSQVKMSLWLCSGDEGDEEVVLVQLCGFSIWSENECSDVVMLSRGDIEYEVFSKDNK